jgi:2-polyprenyl-3-methyl-5-hydroxy-6-metoxy-1,4-benzoquinol methylase
MRESSYKGNELEIFALATNWKRYVGKRTAPFIGKSVLDVGAGLGDAAVYLATSACQSWLYLEPDSYFFDIIQAKIISGELPAICDVLLGTTRTFQQDKLLFDTILYMDVLEHVEDDRSELSRASNLLKDHGFLIIIVPAHPFLYSPFDKRIGHHRRYVKKHFRRICPAEFKIVRLDYLDSVGIVASLANRLFLRNTMPTRKQIDFWDKIMVPISRIIDPLLFNRIGKSLLAVFEKNP